jgi:DUF2075 family protein
VGTHQKEASHDPAIKRRSLKPVELKALPRHTCRVLLTRGMKGTFVFPTDSETRGMLRSLLGV